MPLLLQHLGGVFETLVLQQTLDQFFAGILFGFAFLLQSGIRGKQHARLDVDQRGGHEDELGADVEVHFARLLEVAQVLRRDGGDGDVADVDLLFANEVEQQIERSVIVVEVDIQGR